MDVRNVRGESVDCSQASLKLTSKDTIQPESNKRDDVLGAKKGRHGRRITVSCIAHFFCLCAEPEQGTSKVCPYLPKHNFDKFGKKTLVLDMDETIVHCAFKPFVNPDAIIPITIEDEDTWIYVKKRPGMDLFLRKAAEKFEIVLFTASRGRYALPILSEIDPEGVISHMLFREHCISVSSGFIKDLTLLGRDLKDVVIIDVRNT